MSEHTPGPWRKGKTMDSIVGDDPTARESGTGHEEIEYYGGFCVAESVLPRNQALIIAAPELLEALEACHACIVSMMPHEPCDLPPAALQAIAAIAKAKGEA